MEPIINQRKRKPLFRILNNDEWINDCLFLTDKMKLLQSLNLALQGKGKVITDLIQTIISFIKKFSFLNAL